MTKKALTLALEALEKERPYLGAMPALTSKAITAIKEALSELEQDDEVLGFNGWGFPIEKPNKTITTQTEALKLALETAFDLGQQFKLQCEQARWHKGQRELADKTKLVFKQFVENTIKEALAQPEQQEPNDLTIAYMAGLSRGKDLAPQRIWVGLTDEEIDNLWKAVPNQALYSAIDVFAKAVEAKLKEKNT